MYTGRRMASNKYRRERELYLRLCRNYPDRADRKTFQRLLAWARYYRKLSRTSPPPSAEALAWLEEHQAKRTTPIA